MGLLGLPHVEHPDVAKTLAAVHRGRLVGHHEEVPIGQGERRVRAAAERRIPVPVREEPGAGRVGDVENGQAPIAPGGVREVPGDEGVVERVAPTLAPGRRLGAAPPHAGEPPAPGDLGPPRVGHVDDGEDVIAEVREVDGGIGVPAARVPDAVRPDPVDRHEPDLGRLLGPRDVEDADPGGEAPGAVAELVGRRPLEVVLEVLELLHVPDARTVDRQEQVIVGLEVDGPRVGRTGDELDRPRVRGIADVHDRDSVAEGLADVGVAAMDHDLDAVAPAALVGMADEPDVGRRDGTRAGALTWRHCLLDYSRVVRSQPSGRGRPAS